MNLSKLRERHNIEITPRRYSLPELISESYKVYYECDEYDYLRGLVESHLDNLRSNPDRLVSLSRDLQTLKEMAKSPDKYEDEEEEDVDECDKRRKYDDDEELDEDDSEDNEEYDDEELDENSGDDDAEELTDEEVEALGSLLREMRRKPVKEATRKGIKVRDTRKVTSSRKIKESVAKPTAKKITETKRPIKGIKVLETRRPPAGTKVREHKNTMKPAPKKKATNMSWDTLSESLGKFRANTSSKAFQKTFKKMNKILHEGSALTRRESLTLYKAANSALTHLTVELEHNPEFFSTFTESSELLADSVDSLLAALNENKAPSKRTMRSLAEFSDILIEKKSEEDEDEDILDEDEKVIDSEEEQFFQDYADAREEAHEEVAAKYEDSENPTVIDTLEKDAAEVSQLLGEEEEEEEVEEEEEEEEVEEEEEEEEVIEEEKDPEDKESEISDDELEKLKKYLKESGFRRKKK